MDISQSFGKVLKKYRKHNNLSQEKLALLCDLDRTFISLLERGKRQPGLSTVFVLANQLNIRPSELIKEMEEELL
ncbi:helix-turn-helix domain-containing protein [Alkalihalobacillus sp. BA299]|uniref:helix-turn-helix domain-containing protein n=1 Tax=Alkalihalobacillus sp. BA299 TaxID=2815938 RepID=UPI001AD9BE84|nr:helix-turn-helix transcriptional regulator [Alkalihalobacillus sp. BA299]